MADCRRCSYAWAVHHDPELCWLRSDFFDGHPDAEALLAVRVREAAPLLIAACVALGGIVDTL
ncbi:hypothetical protein [Streptomyces sp. NPDC058279]|uniref:hypothetical protein n=1 Tax=Streptomyces sp. NPDC058279 TaxID=3346418 RepID=UPI0036E00E21